MYATYDDKNLYFLFKCYNDRPGKYITTSLRRDYRGGSNDGISVIIDTYQDKTNAFLFGINPFGVLREGLITNGGEGRQDYSLSWDNKWTGEARILDSIWVAEIAIPFKTLRFKDGTRSFNMNFYRIDTKYNERSTWAHIPRNNQIFNLAFLQEVTFAEPLQKPGANVAVIPYASLNGYQNNLSGGTESKEQGGGYGIGGDVKVGITPALNLDLTINPDFSQVEVDRQVTNLTRFELFFPERRQFFLENADLFANFGGRNARPFFSRRIGIARDTLTGQNVSQPILFGARLSGKVSKDLRVGLMSMQTAPVEEANQPSLNYSVAVLQQKVFTRSNIAAIFVNKEDFQYNDANPGSFHYNRVAGLEYNLASADNVWTGKAFYHYSLEPDNPDSTYSYGVKLTYNKRHFGATVLHQAIGNNFNAEVDFVPRRGFQRFSPEVNFRFYPNGKVINRHGLTLRADVLYDYNWRKTDHKLSAGYNFFLQDQSFLFVFMNEEYIYLKYPFDPTRTGGTPLPANSSYTYKYASFMFRSDQRKRIYGFANGSAGQFFNGTCYNLGGNVNFRFQPYGFIGIDVQYNSVKLPEPYASADLFLVGPRIDITFTKSIYLTGLFQYNNQIDNFNTNIRFQWRYKPVSDIYLVYTDNYYASDFSPKNRSLVFKITYWFSI